MINDKELFEALMNGADPEKMANDFATMLNAAIEQKRVAEAKAKAEAEAKARAEAERKAKTVQKVEDTKHMLAMVNAYLSQYYPALQFNELTAEQFVDVLDGVDKEIRPLVQAIESWKTEVEKPSVRIEMKTGGDNTKKYCDKNDNCKCKRAEDPIERFLREFGL